MTEETGTAIERAPLSHLPAPLITDDEIRIMYRVAESLAASGKFGDVTKAEHAFAKMMVGRDLGMTPVQAVQALHIVKGGVMVSYSMLAQFIRSRREEGYDYRPGWIKLDPALPGAEGGEKVLVWADEEDPLDERTIHGAVVEFYAESKLVGTSTFTIDDARRAKLIKEGGAWETAPRNMLRARAMSNGVKWFVPEVMGGLPIYVEGEIVEKADLTEPTGSGEAQGLDLGPKVEWVIERATELGHAGLANRAAIEVALGSRSPAVVDEWVGRARAELARFETEQAAAAVEADPPDADVVVEGEVEPERPEELSPQPEPVPEAEPAADAPQPATATQSTPTATLLVARLRSLRLARSEAQDPEQKRALDEELDHIETQLLAEGVEIPAPDASS